WRRVGLAMVGRPRDRGLCRAAPRAESLPGANRHPRRAHRRRADGLLQPGHRAGRVVDRRRRRRRDHRAAGAAPSGVVPADDAGDVAVGASAGGRRRGAHRVAGSAEPDGAMTPVEAAEYLQALGAVATPGAILFALWKLDRRMVRMETLLTVMSQVRR